MTVQEKVLLIGAAAALAAKFYFKKSWVFAGVVGLASISAHDLLTAKDS